MRTRPWALVSTPDDPETATWVRAAAAAGVPEPRLVPWASVLDGTADFEEGELVHVQRLVPAVPLRYGGSRERHERLAAALDTLHGRLAGTGATCTIPPAPLLLALDRLRCGEHLASAGVPVPESKPGTGVRQRYAEPGDTVTDFWRGSAHTTLAPVRTRSGFELHHTRTHRYYRSKDNEGTGIEADLVRDLLARDDETVDSGKLPTISLEGQHRWFRFAVVDGRVTHAAGRPAGRLNSVETAREYYGGKRREIDAYRRRCGDPAWQGLLDLAERAAAAFPGLRSVGVDIAPDQTGAPDVVFDVDPFGARLPSALGLAGTAGEGLEVAAATIRAWL